MTIFDLDPGRRLRGLTTTFGRRVRRVRRKAWASSERVHLQLRALTTAELVELGPRLERAIEAGDGVRWARVNGYLRRVVVQFDPQAVTVEALEQRLAQLEAELGISERDLPLDDVNPGDQQPMYRIAIELGADALGLTINTLRQLGKGGHFPGDIDLAAILATIEGVPRIKRAIEQRLSRTATDLLLELTKATAAVALNSESGPITSFARHWLRLRDERARRRVWAAREAELCGDPSAHRLAREELPPRPVPLRQGIIERYEDGAIPIVMSVFGAGAMFSGSVQEAASALFGGLPGSAHRGRSAFAHHLSYLLAERNVLVPQTLALRRLDRLDVVFLDRSALVESSEAIAALVRAVEQAGLRLVIAADQAQPVPGDYERIEPAHVTAEIRRHQLEGRGVLLVARGFHPAYPAADLSVGLCGDGTPWGAHVVAACGLADAQIVVEAIARARVVSKQSVYLAAAEAAVTGALSYSRLKQRTTRQVMAVNNVTALLAMINGIRHAHGLRREVPRAPTPPGEPWHTRGVDEVLEQLGSGRSGLSSREAAERRPPAPPRPSRLGSFSHMVKAELDNPMTPILGAGAGLSALTGAVVDAGLIGAAVGINGLVGGIQRYQTERAVAKLLRVERRPVRVCRDGAPVELPREELVVGDVIELASGDYVPGDCRILELDNLEVDESSLTGESMPVRKQVEPTGDVPVAERASMLYAGTTIAAGSVRAVVVALNADTEAGRAAELSAAAAAPGRGVEARLERLTSLAGPVAGLSAAAVAAAGLVRRRPVREIVTSAVSLGVAAVPEGLPILATMAQLAAARRLADTGALVRNPRSIEPLGRVDVLCADKTGTLTEGHIHLHLVSDGEEEQHLDDLDERRREILVAALRATPIADDDRDVPHATDRALLRGAARASAQPEDGLEQWARVAELPFEPARGYHASVDGYRGGRVLSVKGAPEVVVPRCRARRRDGATEALDDERRDALVERAIGLARRGYRVLAVAERQLPDGRGDGGLTDELVAELQFRGFIAYTDPVRPSARQAISDLNRAGVEVVMVTGDHPSTAEAIGRELGLVNGHRVMTGAELDRLDDEALAARIEEVAVFARVTPTQKVRIVKAFKQRGRTVAMTGDGANDAPAIHLADVGIALGERATSAARHAADMVVTDGRIETIVHAVLEGRALWRSVRDGVSILVGGNVGEIAFTLIGALATGTAPLNTRQLLLVNLITDTLPALAIALRPPRNIDPEALLREGPEASLGEALEHDILWRAAVTTGAATAGWTLARVTGATPARASTVALLGLTASQLGQTLVTGGRSLSVMATGIGSLAVLGGVVQIPGLSHFFGCRPLGPIGLAQAATVSAAATGLSLLGPRVGKHLWPRLERLTRERAAAPPATEDTGEGTGDSRDPRAPQAWEDDDGAEVVEDETAAAAYVPAPDGAAEGAAP